MNVVLTTIRKTRVCQLALVAVVLSWHGFSGGRSILADGQVSESPRRYSGANFVFSPPAEPRLLTRPKGTLAPAATSGWGNSPVFSIPPNSQQPYASNGETARPALAKSPVHFSSAADNRLATPKPSHETRYSQFDLKFSNINDVSASPRAPASREHEAAGPRRGFTFSPPNDDSTNRLFPDSRRTQDRRPPVAFSPPGSTPFQSSWANFLQEDSSDTDSSDSVDKLVNDAEQTLGEAPEETTTTIQFLRQDAILLGPGQYQIDISFQYVSDEADFAVAQVNNNNLLQVAELTRRQRLLLVPVEFRLGVTPALQFFINIPFGWSNAEATVFGQDEFSNSGGVGDISLGFTRQLWKADEFYPNILATLVVSAPTGNSDFATSLATPGSSLGQGFWTTTAALTFIRTLDPVVVFGGFGHQWRFDGTFESALVQRNVTVRPGNEAFYRFGVGFAVNPRVTFSAAFRGSYVADNYIDDVRVPGSSREPMQIRLATTIVRKRGKSHRGTVRTVEPFVNFGLTEGAIDSIFGIGWTH